VTRDIPQSGGGIVFAAPPWSVSADGRLILDAAGVPIACVRLGVFYRAPIQGLGCAIAHLIAAAPDLLAALGEMIDAAGDPAPEVLARAAAVLARATGAGE
jgi:hypothetical protein